VSRTDVVTTSVSATVNTIAGQEDISLQLLEQSPISMDGVLFEDLSRDYDQRLDLQVIGGTGTNGQHLGVLKVVGATTNTDPTKASEISSTVTVFIDPTASNSSQYKNLVNAVNQIETLRFESPTAIWVHPRRANSWSAQPTRLAARCSSRASTAPSTSAGSTRVRLFPRAWRARCLAFRL
jgi:HK97 family phage major capsid protein